tara:strand:+ start:3903 stop:4133 length:231 start_codon:yes stop_codon:yes gene_type:complete
VQNETFTKWPAGTLIEDMGKVGIISKVIPYGAMNTDIGAIKWRKNYEITYVDGDIQVIAESTFAKLVLRGDIKILN